jgi:hypothetical protein
MTDELPPMQDFDAFERETERELNPWRLPFHPIANTFPMMDPSSPEFRGLVASIKGNGLWEPITMHEDMVLDGRNRLRACQEAGVAPRFEDFDEAKDGPPLAFVLAKNLYRRHLTEGQRALKAEEMVTTTHGDIRRFSSGQSIENIESAAKCQKSHLGAETVTIAKAATMWCVKPSAVRSAATVREKTKTVPKILEEVKAGRMTLGKAWKLAEKPAKEQRADPSVKFAGAMRKPKTARPTTVGLLRDITDEQKFAIVVRDLRQINRAAAREGKQVVITDLPQKGLTF